MSFNDHFVGENDLRILLRVRLDTVAPHTVYQLNVDTNADLRLTGLMTALS